LVKDQFLENQTLDRYDWIALRDLAKSLNDFEPIEARAKTGDVLAERLVHMGLVETGPCAVRFAARGFRTGYRLTQLGWYVMDQGRFPAGHHGSPGTTPSKVARDR
jgi:hypothetical protein